MGPFLTLYSTIRYHNKLKWLQLKILRRCLHTNRIVSKYDQDVRNICDFCDDSPENISHLFFRCNIVKLFLGELEQFLHEIHLPVRFNEKNVLFGNPDLSAQSFQNLIILYIKGFIWFCKHSKTRPCLNKFKSYVRPYIKTLKLIATFRNDSDNFDGDWHIIDFHLVEHSEHLVIRANPPEPD